MQAIDAERRMAILRGEVPPPLDNDDAPKAEPPHATSHPSGSDREPHRKRKRRGEDDTDFEMRLARERVEASEAAALSAAAAGPMSLVDSRGHISLFAEPAQAERTDEKKRYDAEDEAYRMRLVNAAGKDGRGLTDGGPWYATAEKDLSSSVPPSRISHKEEGIWGKEDPARKAKREAASMSLSDPLAMMKWGAKQVRELEKERRRGEEEREEERRRGGEDEKRRRKIGEEEEEKRRGG